MAKQKNIVGDLHNVGYARIGDEIHIHLAEHIPPKELTLYIPRTHPDDIIGRDADLTRLHNLLRVEKRVVVVNGLGGIGKSTLAQVYISRYYERYHHIVWITQDSEDIARDFVNTPGLTSNLGLDKTIIDPGQIFNEIIRKLKSIRSQPSLLVIDNGERSLKKYKDLLPGQPHWHVLVTSRSSIAGFHRQPLGFLDEKEAIALFKKHYPHQIIGDAGIGKLVKGVDFHTLSIEMLAKTAAVQRYDLATLQQAIKKDLKANIQVAHSRKGTVEKIGSYLRATFTLSRLDMEEVWLLQQLSHLPPEFHSYTLLRELLIDEKGSHAAAFAEKLSGLADKGWLLYKPAGDSYNMHRIIADVVRQERPVSSTEVARLISMITDRLNTEDVTVSYIEKSKWVPFGTALVEAFHRDTSPRMAALQNHLGVLLLFLGDHAGAKALLEKAARADEKNFGRDHPETTTRYSNLALVLRDLGHYKRAKTIFEKAARDDEKNLGKYHWHTGVRHHNLGLVLYDMGDYAGAKTALERALRIEQRNERTGVRSFTGTATILGLVLKELGNFRAARSMLEKAVKNDEKKYGADHPETMGSYNNLALVLGDIGEHKKERRLLEKVLAFQEKHLGPDHPDTARAYNNLGIALGKMGDHAQAKAMLEKTVLADEKNFGTGHHNTALAYSNLALELDELGDRKGAIALLKKAIRIFEKTLGPTHPYTVVVYRSFVNILLDMDRYHSAKPCLEKLVHGCEKLYGKRTLDTAYAYHDLAFTLHRLKEREKAMATIKKALTVFRRELGIRNEFRVAAEELRGLLLLPPELYKL
ncbi:MAG: tetratricopeptide repeat protein [Chitinophagaceae bacterium]|nr:tetratricopeptide repeat protein [Chitinophagaceae bacterium]